MDLFTEVANHFPKTSTKDGIKSMKKVIVVLCMVFGCVTPENSGVSNDDLESLGKNKAGHEYECFHRCISWTEIKKIRIGQTMDEVKEILGYPFFLMDLPYFTCMYDSKKEGDKFFITFFDIFCAGREDIRNTRKVTAVYFQPKIGKGYCLLPEGIKEESIEEFVEMAIKRRAKCKD